MMARKKKPSRFAVTISDAFALVCSLVFLFYMIIIVRTDTGAVWFNYAMLGTVALFCAFLVIKTFILDIFCDQDAKFSQRIKKVYTVVKYLLKLLMLAILIIGLITIIRFNQDTLPIIIGTITTNIFFLLSLSWDTYKLFFKKKD